MDEQADDYSWSQELCDWRKRQDYYERLDLGNQEVSDEWEDNTFLFGNLLISKRRSISPNNPVFLNSNIIHLPS